MSAWSLFSWLSAPRILQRVRGANHTSIMNIAILNLVPEEEQSRLLTITSALEAAGHSVRVFDAPAQNSYNASVASATFDLLITLESSTL